MNIIREIISFIQNAFIGFNPSNITEAYIKSKIKENLNLLIFGTSAFLIASFCASVAIVLICLNISLQIEQFKNVGMNAELIGSLALLVFSSLIFLSLIIFGHRSLRERKIQRDNQNELIKLLEALLIELTKPKIEQNTPEMAQSHLN